MQTSPAGRNDPCPCGSGVKFKRCCLERRAGLDREIGQLHALVDELGDWAREHAAPAYARGFGEFYAGGLAAFGPAGPDDDELREADLWLTCDVPLLDGKTALESAAGADDATYARLAASELRAWRIIDSRGGGLITAACPLSGDVAVLETRGPCVGDVAGGRLLVARSVQRAPGRFALLGRIPIVDAGAHEEFETLLRQIGADVSEPSRIWREAGGRLAAAAWAWPDEREHTLEGDLVADTHVVYSLVDVEAMVRALDGAPLMTRSDTDDWDDDVTGWHWAFAPGPRPAPAMPAEPGVRWRLCDEDSADPPLRAMLELQWEDESLWLFAPSGARLDAAAAELEAAVPGLLRDKRDRHMDRASGAQRWQRERWQTRLRALAPALRRIRNRQHRAA